MDNLNNKLLDEAQRQPSCLGAVMRSPYFFLLIFNELETILKINEKYFEKSLHFSK